MEKRAQHMFEIHIAAAYGLAEAVFVHRIYVLVRANEAQGRNEHEGRYWTYDSARAVCENCPYWTPRQVEGIIQRCRDKGLILTGKWSANAYDRTNWYTVTDLVRSIYEKNGIELRESGHRSAKKPKSFKEQRKTKERPKRGTTAFGEFKNVYLTTAETDKLCGRWTAAQVAQEIEALSAYMASRRKQYANHYATLIGWLKRDFPPESKKTLIEEDWADG